VSGWLLVWLLVSGGLGAALSCGLLKQRQPPSSAGLRALALYDAGADLQAGMAQPAFALTCLGAGLVLLAHPLSVLHLAGAASVPHRALSVLLALGWLNALFVGSVVLQFAPRPPARLDEVLPR